MINFEGKFVQGSKTAWWYNYKDRLTLVEEVLITIYFLDKFGADFSFKFHKLSGGVFPRLEIFSESWWVFKYLPELMQLMSSHQGVDGEPVLTPEILCQELLKFGFIDATHEERFWIDDNPEVKPFQDASVGVVDEREGGVIAYFNNEEDAQRFIGKK